MSRSSYEGNNAKTDTQSGVVRGGDADGSYTWTKEVKLTQTQDGWQNDSLKDQTVGTVKLSSIATIKNGATVKVVYTQKTNAVTFEAK